MVDDLGAGASAGACFYSSFASWDLDHGGYVALAVTSNYVKMWAFNRNNPPNDLLGASPNPDAWSTDNLVGLLDSPACPIDTAFPTAIKIQLQIVRHHPECHSPRSLLMTGVSRVTAEVA